MESQQTEDTRKRVKVVRVDAKQKHKEAVKRYYEKHKDEKSICEICLGKITFSNKWNHKQSAIHIRHVEKLAAKRAAEEAALQATEEASKQALI
jgi:hypothetical protein